MLNKNEELDITKVQILQKNKNLSAEEKAELVKLIEGLLSEDEEA
jgi:hypothetical protein